MQQIKINFQIHIAFMPNYHPFYFQVSNEKFNINTNQMKEVISEQKEEFMASKKKLAVCVICTHICGHVHVLFVHICRP